MSSSLSIAAIIFFTASLVASHGVNNLVIQWTTSAQAAVRTGGHATRTYALTHLSIYRTLTTTKLSSYSGANVIAAGNFAAHYTLSSLYPGLQNSVFDITLKAQLAPLSLSTNAFSKSKALGKYHSLLLINSRSNDGTFDYLPYTPADPITALPGQYQFTPNQNFTASPNGGNVLPLISSVKVKDFDEGGPYSASSAAFAKDLAEVKAIGSMNSTTRTAYQTETAKFYALGGGTAGVPGQWFSTARHYISPQNPDLTPLQTSKIYTLVALAQHHAGILAFSQKYKYKYWRPITAIRLTDPMWTPMLGTPPHPEYPSGHSLVAAASAYALARAVNSTVFRRVANFSVSSDSSTPSTRYFTRLKDIVDEAGMSRIYGGVHYRRAVDHANTMGYKIAKLVVDKFV